MAPAGDLWQFAKATLPAARKRARHKKDHPLSFARPPDPVTRQGLASAHRAQQVAALCYRIEGGRLQVLLITSRGTRRWILPKGWPVAGKDGPESARIEAWEEAGVSGRIGHRPLGRYCYRKRLARGHDLLCEVTVYPLRVTSLAVDYPERGQRRRKWMRRKKAARRIAERDLAWLVRRFDPRRGRG